MSKRLRTIVSILQVALVIVLFAWEKLCHTERILMTYVMPAERLVKGLNFPLVIAWFPIVYPLNYLSTQPVSSTVFAIVTLLLAVTIIASVAFFWYFVVAELQLRSQGNSIIRFAARRLELLKIVVLFIFGLAALLYAYIQTNPLWHISGGQTEAVVVAFFPTLWGLALIAISLFDKRLFNRAGGSAS